MELSVSGLMTRTEHMDADRSRDLALLQRSRAGDADACAELLRRYRDRAVNLAYGILHNRSDAEDAAQEAFIRVFTSSASFHGDSSFFSWLYRVVINVSINTTRKRSRSEISLELELVSLEEASSSDMEMRLEMEEVLSTLPIQLKTILVLREVDQLSYEEIGEILEIPIGTVRSRLRSAREMFRRKYKEMI